MREVEEKSHRKTRKGEIQKILLETVKLAGILSVGLIAPNVLSSMAKLGLIENPRQREIVNSSVARLCKKGLLKFNGKFYELTSEGEKVLRRWELKDYKLPKSVRWDKKWRIIIFDIPEKKRKERDIIRSLFVEAGLYRLQDSVWVYPYDCEEIIGLLKADFGVGKNILYIIADEIENDKYLISHFNLQN